MQKSMQPGQLDLGRLNQERKLVSKYILVQLFATLLLSAALLIYDLTAAYSAVTGGLIATLANAWFALKVFRVKPEAAPAVLLTAFYVGEIYKFVLTGAMFIIAIVTIKPLNIVALLGIYFTIHMVPAAMNALGLNSRVKNRR
jgi:ATP synthase protein I